MCTRLKPITPLAVHSSMKGVCLFSFTLNISNTIELGMAGAIKETVSFDWANVHGIFIFWTLSSVGAAMPINANKITWIAIFDQHENTSTVRLNWIATEHQRFFKKVLLKLHFIIYSCSVRSSQSYCLLLILKSLISNQFHSLHSHTFIHVH